MRKPGVDPLVLAFAAVAVSGAIVGALIVAAIAWWWAP
jgi:hypothetical protein